MIRKAVAVIQRHSGNAESRSSSRLERLEKDIQAVCSSFDSLVVPSFIFNRSTSVLAYRHRPFRVSYFWYLSPANIYP